MEWVIFLLVLLFVLGLVFGSFLNVVILRTIAGESPAKGRSKCPKCKHQLAWYDNIPLLSFVWLRARCRYCKKPISWQYPVVELSTALLFVWWYGVGFAFFKLTQTPFVWIQPLFWLTVGILLLIILVTDLRYMIIPDYAVAGLGLMAVCYRSFLSFKGVMQWVDFGLAIVVGMVMMGVFYGLWYFTKGKGMGFGDVKYVMAMGLLLGWPKGLVGLFVAFVLGALVGLGLLFAGKVGRKSLLPFGPFLVLGTVIALIYGMDIWNWYMGLMGV